MTSHKKVAVVFGGSGGIGQAVAKALSEQMTVYATFFQHQPETQQNIYFERCDIRDETQVKNLLQKIQQTERQIAVVINATTAPLKLLPFEQLSTQDYQHDFEVITLGGINIVKAALPLLKEHGGCLVTLLTSILKGPAPGRMASYFAAKSALQGFINCVRSECKKPQLRIVNVLPYYVETPLIQAFPAKLLELAKAKLPGGNFLQPKDLAQLVLKITQDSEKKLPQDILLEHQADLRQYL